MKTLIVEDDFTNRLMLQEILQRYGPCHIAVNGVEALEAVRFALGAEEPYDLICMDLMMPEMNGQEALRKIRLMEEAEGVAVPDRAKVIIITNRADVDSVLMAQEQLCNCFLIKPIQKARLLKEVRNLALLD